MAGLLSSGLVQTVLEGVKDYNLCQHKAWLTDRQHTNPRQSPTITRLLWCTLKASQQWQRTGSTEVITIPNRTILKSFKKAHQTFDHFELSSNHAMLGTELECIIICCSFFNSMESSWSAPLPDPITFEQETIQQMRTFVYQVLD